MASESRVRHSFPARARSLLAAAGALALAGSAIAQPYVDRLLADNMCCGPEHFDSQLRDAWGIAFDPTGPAWVASSFGGRAELLDGSGANAGPSVIMEVPPLFNGGFVTGLVFPSGNEFLVSSGAGPKTPARVLFAERDGNILGWTPAPPNQPENTLARIAVNRFNLGCRYFGLALAQTANGNRIFAADFHNRKIDTFNGSFTLMPQAFVDPNLPAGFTPFNIRTLGGRVLVSYTVKDPQQDDVIPGPGNGIIDVFGIDGSFQSRLVNRGVLNAPWGMVIAPPNFGAFSNALLVANNGDGLIHAFNPTTGALLGTLSDSTGVPIFIDGIRGLEFGNGLTTQATNTLFYAAGPTFAVVGIFGRIDVAPGTGCIGDYNHDGFIDGKDSDEFNNAFEAGDPNADLNNDGFIDGADSDLFTNRFNLGC